MAPFATALLLGEAGRCPIVFTGFSLALATLAVLLVWVLTSRGAAPESFGARPVA